MLALSERIIDRALVALATPERFRAWLAAVPPERPIGKTCHSGRCPVARFLRDTLSLDAVPELRLCVGSDGVHVYGLHETEDGAGGRAARWVGQFIRTVDQHAPYADTDVTAGEALAILDRLTATH